MTHIIEKHDAIPHYKLMLFKLSPLVINKYLYEVIEASMMRIDPLERVHSQGGVKFGHSLLNKAFNVSPA